MFTYKLISSILKYKYISISIIKMGSEDFFVEPNATEALKRFVTYEKRRKEDDRIIISRLVGISNEKGFIHKGLGNSRFENHATPIPEGFKKKRYTKDWALKYYLNKYFSQEDIAKLNEKGCDYD